MDLNRSRLTVPIIIGFLFALSALGALTDASAQDPPAPEGAVEDADRNAEYADRSALRRRHYSGFFPFYSYEEFENGRKKMSALFTAIRFESEPDGDFHNRVLPFYSHTVVESASDSQLALYPLLYFRRRSRDSDYDVATPFFARWRKKYSRHLLLWPLSHTATNPRRTPFRFIPVLYRSGTSSSGSSRRIGAPYILDIYSGFENEQRKTQAIGTLLPFPEEPARFLSLAYRETGPDTWRAHLFPLFSAGRVPDGKGYPKSWFYSLLYSKWSRRSYESIKSPGRDVSGWSLPILLTRHESSEEGYDFTSMLLFRRKNWPLTKVFRILPLFASHDQFHHDDPSGEAIKRDQYYSLFYWSFQKRYQDNRRDTHIVPPLLSSYAWDLDDDENYSYNVLFPLIHGSRVSEEQTKTRYLPLYDYSLSPTREYLGYGGILYRRHRKLDSDYRSDWFLYPIIRHTKHDEGGITWALPFYFSTIREGKNFSRRSRFIIPFYFSEDSQEETFRRRRRYIIPFYYSGDSQGETFSRKSRFFVPFYFSEDSQGETYRQRRRFFMPLYFSGDDYRRFDVDNEWTLRSAYKHFWPLYGHMQKSFGDSSRKYDTDVTLYPLFQHRTETIDGELWGRRIDAPWPLLRHESDQDSWNFYLFPLAFMGSSPKENHFTLFPLTSVKTGSETSPGFWHRLTLAQWHSNEGYSEYRTPFLFKWQRRQYGQGRGGSELKVTGPLWWFYYRRSEKSGWFHLLPLGYGTWDENGDRLGVFPLFYMRDSRRRDINYWSLARFFFLWNRLESESETYHSLLWKAFEYTSGGQGDHDVRILHRLFVHRESKGQKELVVNPFFSTYEDAKTGDKRFSILGFLYRSRTTGGVTNRSILFIPLGG